MLCFDLSGLGEVPLGLGPLARLLVNAASKTIGPEMVRIQPDHLGAIGNGQVKVALIVIGAGPGEVGVGELRTKTDGLAEALNSGKL